MAEERQRAREEQKKAFSLYKEIPDYPLGCEVILTIPNPEPERFYEGILRWIGSHDGYFWGVVQLNEIVEGGTDGTFRIDGQTVKLVDCPNGTAHWAVLTQVSIPPKNLKIGDNVRLRGTESRGVIKWKGHGVFGILLSNTTEGPKGKYRNEKRFECGPNEGSAFLERKYIEYLGRATEPEHQPQRKLDSINELCGMNKGIQGENISSYLDTLLFVCFAFTTALQSKILEIRDLSEKQTQARNVLLEKIVYPLRRNCYVSSNLVMEFRQLLVEITGNDKYIGYRRDFFECFDDFVEKLFKIHSLVEVIYEGPTNREFEMLHLQIFCKHPYETTYAWADELFVETSVEHEYRLKKVPNYLVLNMMRFEKPEKEGSFSCVIPCLELELKDRLDVQTGNAGLCQTLPGGAAAVPATIDIRSATVGASSRDSTRLLLSGIVCFERSHYDCFARCGRISDKFRQLKDCPWVHFSSLADRENVANIPEVRQVPVYEWITYAREKSKTDSPIEDLLLPDMSREDRDLAERLFDRSYALIFENH